MTLATSIEIRDHLVRALEADLIGPVIPEVPDEVLAFAPSRFYLCGFLAPEGGRDVTPDDEDDQLDAVSDARPTDSDEKEGEVKERRLFPAINLAASGTRKEHLLMGEQELKTMTALRRRLMNMPPHQQVEQLLAALQRFPTNSQLVGSAANAPGRGEE